MDHSYPIGYGRQVAQAVSVAMQTKGLSVSKLAALSGPELDRHKLRRRLRNGDFTVPELALLAPHLEVTVSDLLADLDAA